MTASPARPNVRLRAVLFLALLPLALFGAAWLLVNPSNPVNRMFRAPITDIDARIVVGPYPGENDFANLRAHGVTTIVSLLDARVPYEETLLARERDAAARFGFRFLNFPMTSFLGQHLGANYDQMAAAAAQAIQASGERTYLHCYLGVHRVATVRDQLTKARVETAKYLPRSSEALSRETLAERVSMRFEAGDFAGALQWYAGIAQPAPPIRLLAAWAHLRLNQVSEAETLFAAVAQQTPALWDSANGLAYCALRRNQLAAAEQGFLRVLAAHPGDQQANVGLAVTVAHDGQYARAMTLLRAVLAAHPGNAEAAALLREYEARGARLSQES